MTPAQLKELGFTLPPTQADLPFDDNGVMETQRHKLQMELLIDGIDGWLESREDGYVGGNMFVYYSLAQVRNQDFKGPDFFVALGVPKKERLSWVSWEEGKTPDVVIELLSPSTISADKGEKKTIYQDRLHTPEYFWYDPFNPEDWAGFRLQGGTYQAIEPDSSDRLISSVLDLALARWLGIYKGVETTWLRWVELDGTLLPTAAERAQQEAEQERQRADQAERRADRLAERLRAMGIDPDQV
ncbi:hypothetical protein C7271_16140 [filamentous cyanobacterium CCP5]|nr:hypothetical protein C7271_16140 [filamentous cyanobacterium CCP5]